MKKLTSLRQHLLGSVPALIRDPDRLLTFVEDGSVEFHRGDTLSHQYAFMAQLVLTDFADDMDTVMVPLLQWLSRYQPDVTPAEAVSFEAEILSNDAYDLALRVRLTERVVALVDCETGTINADHRMPSFESTGCMPTQWQLFTRENSGQDYQQLSAWSDGNGQ